MKGRRDEAIEDQLTKMHHCYVLVTCGAPTKDGEMGVTMNYAGPPELASYLLHGAQSIIDREIS